MRTTIAAVALALATTTNAHAGGGPDHGAVCDAIGADNRTACIERQREALADIRGFLKEHGVMDERSEGQGLNPDNFNSAHAWIFGQCGLQNRTEAGMDTIGVRTCINRQMFLFKRMKQAWAEKADPIKVK